MVVIHPLERRPFWGLVHSASELIHIPSRISTSTTTVLKLTISPRPSTGCRQRCPVITSYAVRPSPTLGRNFNNTSQVQSTNLPINEPNWCKDKSCDGMEASKAFASASVSHAGKRTWDEFKQVVLSQHVTRRLRYASSEQHSPTYLNF